MSNTIVFYFSASNVTKKVAKDLIKQFNFDEYEIIPTERYTSGDLNYFDSNSRSSIEYKDQSIRPDFIKRDIDISKYENIFIGFPIWWYQEPRIINSVIEYYNLQDKEVIIFATSGGSTLGSTIRHLKEIYPNIKIKDSLLLNGDLKINHIKNLLKI